ncbi:MAG: glycosyltransferase family 2 protein [Prevotella sp.]|nr:glycosyltransferase family 2 protein [Prevotella sp.]
MKDISILIPTYNSVCTELVMRLAEQAADAGIGYEVIVADDGSTDRATVEANRRINSVAHCRLIERSENCGRAAIRNFLAQQAQYPWLLFIDSDMVVRRTDYVRRYATAQWDTIVYGGIEVNADGSDGSNLRAIYEKAHEGEHTVERRRLAPYHDFHTANFMVRRDIMTRWPFDMRFRRYGYEDVLFGKKMEQQHIEIAHIDNPLSFEVFEQNDDFVSKTEEGLRTLHAFRDELRGYSRLIDRAERLPHYPILLWHKMFGGIERRILTSRHPSLAVFNMYKLGYYVSMQ